MIDLGKYRKTVVAIVGAVMVSLTLLLPAQYKPILTPIAAVLTALGVYGVPNTPQEVSDPTLNPEQPIEDTP